MGMALMGMARMLWARRFGWFVGLWALGVATLGLVAAILEVWIKG